MSSTDADRIRRFFHERLVPAAEKLRERGVRFFPTDPEPEADTWYVDASRGEAEFTELEAGQVEERLRELWEGQELPELAALAGPLLELADALETPEEDSAEISPFVYVMY